MSCFNLNVGDCQLHLGEFDHHLNVPTPPVELFIQMLMHSIEILIFVLLHLKKM